jgi:hypothetical protein
MTGSGELRINKAELENIIRATAHTTVQECQASFMATLGLNIADSDDVKAFQANIRFAESLRIGSSKVGARVAMTCLTVMAGAIAIAAWEWTKGLVQLLLHTAHG